MGKTKQEIVDNLAFNKGSDTLPQFLRDASLGMIENLVYDAMDEYNLSLKLRISKLEQCLEDLRDCRETWSDLFQSDKDVITELLNQNID